MIGRKRKRLGDLLVDAGVVTSEQLGEALKKQRELGLKLGETLIELKFTDENEIVEALHQQMGYPIAKIREAKIAPEVISLLPETIVRKHNVVPFEVDPDNPNQIKKDTVSALYPESEDNKVSSPQMTTDAHLTGNIDMTDPELTSVDGRAISVSIYDALGYNYTVKFKLTQDQNQADKSLYNLEIVSIKDSNNIEITGTDDPTTATVEGGYKATIGGANSIQVKFDADTGNFEYVGAAGQKNAMLEIKPNNPNEKGDVFQSVINGEAVDGIDVNFSYLTRFESNGKSTVKAVRGAADSTGGGRSMGKLNDVSIDETGKLYGVYTNGETKLLGQISVATFANPMALEALGNSVYTTTQNSGYFDGIGTSVDEDGGKISQGVLEMSNVDLSAEFTDMITTQRGFQANSRIITTSDSMLEELVNLKR